MSRKFYIKLAVLIGIVIVIVFAIIACSGTREQVPVTDGDAAGGLSSTCADRCHEMNPEVETWRISAHNMFDCTACHQVDVSKMEQVRNQQDVPKPIKISVLISNEICRKCHSKNRVIIPGGDLIIPHVKHENKGVQCVKCHNGVVHARISERDVVNKDGFDDYAKWNERLARKIFTGYYTTPDMWICIKCHKAKSVTTKCRVCHSEIPGLDSHALPTWKTKHGLTARVKIDQCSRCHVTPDAPKKLVSSTGDPAADFARLQEFCYSCHTKKPESHEGGNMRQNHPALEANRGISNCLTCHDYNEPKVTENVTGTYCNQCHQFTKEILDAMK
ncbi:MAG: cytochrome c3 family protein [Bacillota bacterium]